MRRGGHDQSERPWAKGPAVNGSCWWRMWWILLITFTSFTAQASVNLPDVDLPLPPKPSAEDLKQRTLPDLNRYSFSSPARAASSDQASPRWLKVYETSVRSNFYSRFIRYIDLSTLRSGVIEGITFHSVRIADLRISDGRVLVEDVSIICDGYADGPALSIRRLGEVSNLKIDFDVDVGEIKSLEELDFTNVKNEDPYDFIERTVFAVCRQVRFR